MCRKDRERKSDKRETKKLETDFEKKNYIIKCLSNLYLK